MNFVFAGYTPWDVGHFAFIKWYAGLSSKVFIHVSIVTALQCNQMDVYFNNAWNGS